MDKPPAAGSIVAESEDKALGLTMLTLSNGVKVILKPTDFSNDQVLPEREPLRRPDPVRRSRTFSTRATPIRSSRPWA